MMLAYNPDCVAAKAPKKVSQQEYAKLVTECRNIAIRTLRENDFAPIKQRALTNHKDIMGGLENRFGFKAGTLNNNHKLNLDLAALEAQHNLQVLNLISNTITSYLQTLNTPTSRQLLADFIAGTVKLQ